MELEEVFVVGGQPTITYYERDGSVFEKKVRNYLQRRPNKVLSLSGQTKSGKTVLVNRVIGADCCMVPGGSVESTDDFWDYVAFGAGVYGTETANLSHVVSDTKRGKLGIKLGVDAGGELESADSVTRGVQQSGSSRWCRES